MKKLIPVLILLFISEYCFSQYYQIQIKVSDGFSTDTLRIGYDPTATNGIDAHLNEFELPPNPPTGVFDTRLYSDSANVQLGQGVKRDYRPGQGFITTTTYHKIKFQPSSGSVGIRVTLLGYQPGAQGYQELNIKDFFGGIIVNSTFSAPDTGSVLITNFGITGLILTLRVIGVNPVELSGFYSLVYANDVHLHWITGSETGNRGFEVQRKLIHNEEWTPIGFVDGQGNTSALNEYDFVDRNLHQGRYNYRLKQIDLNGNYEFHLLENEVDIIIPGDFELLQNYPNPFNPVTTIPFQLSKPGKTMLTLYNAEGKKMGILLNEFRNAGYYEHRLDGTALVSGVYYVVLESNGMTETKSIVMLK